VSSKARFLFVLPIAKELSFRGLHEAKSQSDIVCSQFLSNVLYMMASNFKCKYSLHPKGFFFNKGEYINLIASATMQDPNLYY
jgi:hypothetical protein